MKLFLSSIAILDGQGRALTQLAGKTDPKDVKLAIIENGADTYEEDKKAWVVRARDAIVGQGFTCDFVDLNQYRTTPNNLKLN